jgi:hypothetical protein
VAKAVTRMIKELAKAEQKGLIARLRTLDIVVGMDAPSECATIMRKRDAQREPQTTKPNTILSQ